MAGDPWTPTIEAWIVANPKATYWEFVNTHGSTRSYESWRQKRARLLKDDREPLRPMVDAASEEVIGHQTLREPASDEQWDAHFRDLTDADERAWSLGTMQQQTTWLAPENDLPVGVVFSGDWHCGSRGVWYSRLLADLDLLRTTPGLYGVHMGDAHEGVSVHSKANPALYTGLFNSADEQELFVRLRVKQAGNKWLAWLSGNHDEWIAKHAGLSRINRLAGELQIPHFGEGGGTIFAHVGSHRYAIGVRHNHAGKALNTTNPQRRMFDEWPEWENLHVATIAHFHFNDMQVASRKSKRCVYLRCGTYKLHDAYAKAGGFTPEYGTPMVVLYPDMEKVLAFRGDDIEDGLRFLATERQRYANRA